MVEFIIYTVLSWKKLAHFENKPPPLFDSKFLYRYFYLIYKPPTPMQQKMHRQQKWILVDQQERGYSWSGQFVFFIY